MTRATANWTTIAVTMWWRWLGIDLLMVDARDRLARRIGYARALLECEEESDDDAEEERGQDQEEDGHVDGGDPISRLARIPE